MLSDGAWSCRPAFLIGGGPSLATLDWTLLRDVPNAICVNRSFVNVPSAAAMFTEDERFIRRFAAELNAFTGEVIYHALAPEYVPAVRDAVANVRIIERKRQDKYWSRSLSEGLSISSNSAIGALNLLDILDANPIYLLGIDCVPEAPANYHDDYPQDWRSCADQMRSFKSDFEHWAKPNLRGRIVINLNRASGVECWTRTPLTYNEALAKLCA